MNARMREIEKLTENFETDIQTRRGIYLRRKDEHAALKLQKRAILNSLTRFTEIQYSNATEIIANLKQLDDQDLLAIDPISIKTPKRNFSLIIFVFVSLFNRERIMSDSAMDCKSAVEILRNKKRLIEKFEEVAHYDEKTFKAPNLKIMGKLRPIFSSFISIEEEKLPTLLLILYRWCEFWYSQVLTYYEMQAKLERLQDIERKLGFNEEYFASFEKSIKELEQSVGQLQGEKQTLNAEDAELNLSMAVMEVENNHFEMIDKVILTLEKKFSKKLQKLEIIFKTLEGDLLVVALNLAYLGVIDKKGKTEVLGKVVNELQRKENSEEKSLVFSEKWAFDGGFLEKYLRGLLKGAGKEELCKKLQFKDDVEKLGFYELILLDLIEKEVSELREFTKGNVVLYCNLGFDFEDFMPFSKKILINTDEVGLHAEGQDLLMKAYVPNVTDGDNEEEKVSRRGEVGEKELKDMMANNIIIGIFFS